MYDEGSDYSSSEVSESTENSSVETTDATSESELYENTDSTKGNESTELYSEEGEPDFEKELEPTEDKPTEVKETDEGKATQEVEDEEGVEEDEENEDDEDQESGEADAVRIEINENSPYSQEVNDHISSVEELDVYKNAGLVEGEVDGRTCLIREDIDLDYIDPKSGKSNRELMEKGRAPYDKTTGERLELHHIGQEYDSPLAELTEDSQHGDSYSTLHTKEGESWRNDSKKENHYNGTQRPNHWKARL